MAGLFSLATWMLLLVVAVAILLAGLLLHVGAKLTGSKGTTFGKALLATLGGSIVTGVLSLFCINVPAVVPLLGGIVVMAALAVRLFSTSYGRALVAVLIQAISLAAAWLVFVSLPDPLLVPFSNTIIYQGPDPEFEAHVARPAYVGGPRVLFDEAHFNSHTIDGSYRAFADLITQDGYQVVHNDRPFTSDSFEGFDILVIVNARGGDNQPGRRGEPAFTEAECDALQHWVALGGSLLLVADHAPYGSAARDLSNRFRVKMSNTFTIDPAHNAGEEAAILFSRENGLLTEHPIMIGRDLSERIERVISLSGQSLRAPDDAGLMLLRLSNSAIDIADEDRSRTSAKGAAQAIALEVGEGRVVVLAEAAMLTAQVFRMPFRPFERGGLHTPGSHNQQFALNIMHWLSRLDGLAGSVPPARAR